MCVENTKRTGAYLTISGQEEQECSPTNNNVKNKINSNNNASDIVANEIPIWIVPETQTQTIDATQGAVVSCEEAHENSNKMVATQDESAPKNERIIENKNKTTKIFKLTIDSTSTSSDSNYDDDTSSTTPDTNCKVPAFKNPPNEDSAQQCSVQYNILV